MTSSIAQATDEYAAILNEYFSSDGPGATAIVTRGDDIVYRGAVGKASLELDVDMRPEHIFRIGSITKQFTAVAILMLQEQGKLSAQDPITRFLPDYPTHGNTITIEHLLTHTSGIQSYTDIPGWMATETRKDRTLKELISEFKDHPMNFKPGEEWRYNNSGYILLGAIIEAASGMTYADFLQQYVFDALGLQNTRYDEHGRVIPHRIPGYMPGPDGPRNADFLSMTLPHAAGSLISNVDDLARWNRLIHAGKLVSKETLASAFKPYVLNDGSNTGYGYGWSISKIGPAVSYEHGGGIHGFLTEGIYVPEHDVYVAVLSNCNCNPPGHAAIRMAGLATGHSYEIEAVSIDDAILEEYEGVYDIENSEDLRVITIENGTVYSKRGAGPRQETVPVGRDKFAYPSSFTTLEFVRDDAGKVIGQYVIPRSGQAGYAEKTNEQVTPRETVDVHPDILDRYVGDYELMPGFVLTISREGRQLIGAATGQGSVTMSAASETEFFVDQIGAEIEFVLNDAGDCEKLILNQGGQTLEGKRMK
ncbi:MAG: serine hydrolase [Saprospiraceae bacterium]|nr:serine hydrolase [Saprospiraceae bacterium]